MKRSCGCIQLTALLRPLRDSASHFRNSCEGETGVSSALITVCAGFDAAEAWGDRAGAVPFTRTAVADATLDAEVDGVGIGRAVTAAGAAFPLGPTVVQALLGGCVTGGYNDALLSAIQCKNESTTLLVVSA